MLPQNRLRGRYLLLSSHSRNPYAQVALEIVPDALTGLERPEGVLSVDLVEAVNVPKADLFKWSDPYVV